jgi:hypothetical protein
MRHESVFRGAMKFVLAVSLSLGFMSGAPAQQTRILGEKVGTQPGYGSIENLTILAYTDIDGWDEAAEFRVSKDGKTAYISNYKGFSILDVSDPTKPVILSKTSNHPSVQSQYIDVLDDLLVVNQEGVRDEMVKDWVSGIRMFDIKNPRQPREIGFFQTAVAPLRGTHGFWLHQDDKGNKYAFVATQVEGYFNNILIIVDVTDPAKAREIARWWYPGQHTAGGETKPENWVTDAAGLRSRLPNIWVSLHDITVYKDRAYLAYRDQGVIILDISNIAKPTRVGQIKWSPPEEGNTHSIGVVVPKHGGRPDIILATDELLTPADCPFGYIHVIDVRYDPNPVQIGSARLPLNRYCPPDRPGRRFGIHDVERMIKGDIVWSAWENGGFWGFDISDPYAPRPVAHFVPPVFTRAKSDSGHADDVFVHENGLIFATSSDPGGGFWIMRYTPGVKGTVSWNADQKSINVQYEKPPARP